MGETDLIPSDFPKPARRRRGGKATVKEEARKQGLEAAAIAYVQMENGEYRYPDGAKRVRDDDGNLIPNKRELMRRAGYAPGSLDHFDEYVGTNDRFWELVELHRLRRTDPMFRKDAENLLWGEVGSEALRNLYERVMYYPHDLSTEQHIKIIKLILDAGVTLQKMGAPPANRTDELFKSIPEDKRDSVMKNYKEKLVKELESVENLESARRGLEHEG